MDNYCKLVAFPKLEQLKLAIMYLEHVGLQPIEKAPRDGTPILVVVKTIEGKKYDVIRWNIKINLWFPCNGGGHIMSDGYYSSFNSTQLEGWLPLPNIKE